MKYVCHMWLPVSFMYLFLSDTLLHAHFCSQANSSSEADFGFARSRLHVPKHTNAELPKSMGLSSGSDSDRIHGAACCSQNTEMCNTNCRKKEL